MSILTYSQLECKHAALYHHDDNHMKSKTFSQLLMVALLWQEMAVMVSLWHCTSYKIRLVRQIFVFKTAIRILQLVATRWNILYYIFPDTLHNWSYKSFISHTKQSRRSAFHEYHIGWKLLLMLRNDFKSTKGNNESICWHWMMVPSVVSTCLHAVSHQPWWTGNKYNLGRPER